MKNNFLVRILFVFCFVFALSFGFADLSLAQECGPNEFCNPLEYKTVEELLPSILDYVRSIIIVLSMIFIVIGAILYITSAGNESKMTLAKGAIVAASIGLAVGVAAPTFLREISVIVGWEEGATEAGGLSLAQILLNILNFLLGIVGVIGIIMLVSSGIMYMSSAGDQGKIDTAKNMTKWAIIGIAVALAAMVIVRQIASFFS